MKSPFLLSLFFASVSAAAPVASWDFGTEETTRLTAHGGVHRDQPGPRPPEFPDFPPDNTAVAFDGSGARFTFDDPGAHSGFDFRNGDAITLEAWVNVKDIGSGDNRYIIGKGRTGNPGFPGDNQNWALRVREQNGEACLSFLFATNSGGKHAWHRWTSVRGFRPGDGWHHVAATYVFGEPDSIRGWIDGKRMEGNWDMGGATREEPVVDDDAIWIASAMGGSASNSFRGLLDEIAVHREVLPDDVLEARFHREGPPRVVKTEVPALGKLTPGVVTVSLLEGAGSHTGFPLTELEESCRFELDHFFMHRLPFQYDDWGIRDSWKAPVLSRMATEMTLTPGRHTFLFRTRGLTRLWVNGKIVAISKAHGGSTDGHNPVTPVAEPPLPGLTPVPYGDQERVLDVEINGDGKCRVILESLVGGKKLRPTTGSMLLAVKPDGGETYHIVSGSGAGYVLKDRDLANVRDLTEERIRVTVDDARRRNAAASQDAVWKERHRRAREWAKSRATENGGIDLLLKKKMDDALAAADGDKSEAAQKFHGDVLPVLSENCFRCHGEKDKGDLRLNSREAALDAIVPGKPEESELLVRVVTDDEDERMPPKGDGLSPEEVELVKQWIESGAEWPAPPVSKEEVTVPPTAGDAAFIRRAYLDTVGVPPTEAEVKRFLAGSDPDKRASLIERLLKDERYADHWVSYWQDVLAENPNMLKPSLNNSGPFRWFLHDSLRDNKPFDRMVTELIMMRGSEREGGSAGFGMAADNDAPFAAKAHVIGTAFLGVEMQCARCHDSPYHSTRQKDLYSLAAMLERKTVTVPETSRVPAGFFEEKEREALIKVTLKPNEPVEPVWPFGDLLKADTSIKDSRARLAAAVTSAENERFAKVTVNRIWRRLIGAGFVEPAHDWEAKEVSHPELLTWLARDFVASGYDLKHLIRTIMMSDVYGREAVGENLTAPADRRFFAAPDRRRLTAEQVVDSLFAAAGKRMRTEELTFDPDGRRPAKTMISLGFPQRAWELVSLSNERDRPSLSLPRARAVCDVLEAFGWVASRQNPRTDRESDPNVLQPGVLANSTVSSWITRAGHGSELAQLAVDAVSPDALVESLFVRFLTRAPSPAEREACVKALASGFESRLVPAAEVQAPPEPVRLPKVSWSNHLAKEANSIQLKAENRARAGDPPDPRLRPEWREAYEDLVWSLINSPEFVWIP